MKARKRLAVLVGIVAVMTGSLLAYAAEQPQEPAAPAAAAQTAACPYGCAEYPNCGHNQTCPAYPDCGHTDGCPAACPQPKAPERPAWRGGCHGAGHGGHHRW